VSGLGGLGKRWGKDEVNTIVDQTAVIIEQLVPTRATPTEVAAALSAAGLLYQEGEREDLFAPVLRVLPEECWVTRSPLARCTDLIGGVFSTGATWTEEMCCVPCRVRLAVRGIRTSDG